MILLLSIIITSIVLVISHWWYTAYSQRKQLQWLPGELGLPCLGIALELKENTNLINVLGKYTRKHNGLCWVNVLMETSVLATDYKFVEFILASTTVLDKGPIYGFLVNWLGTGLLTAPGTKWKKMRKILTPAFHFSILEQFIPIFESNVETLLGLLKNESRKGIFDVCPFITMYTLDNICETAMGVKMNAQINNQSEYVLAVKEMCIFALQRTKTFIGRYNFTYPLSRNFYRERKVAKILHRYTDNVIHSRKEELSTEKSENEKDEVGSKRKMAFLDLLLKSTLDGKALSHNTIRDEVNTFMFAGHDTTASSINSVIYCLATHPEVQEKAFEEQKIIYEDDINRCTTYSDLQEMKYLDRIIKETLRLYPSVPFISRFADKDIHYEEGKIIPEGVEVLIFIQGINRNPDVFPNPDKFQPERFESSTIPPYFYIPFSAGPRNCIGQKFALLEIKLTLSKLIRNFKMISPGPKYEPIFTSELVFHSINGIHVLLEERKVS